MQIFMAINQPLSSEQRVRWYIQRKKSSRYEKHIVMPLWSDISLS